MSVVNMPPRVNMPPPSIEWADTTRIFEPLSPASWVVRELQLGPGRPNMITGYGASAKTLSAQQLGLAVASGTRVWDRFECEQGRVLHVDYEQGFRATARRYQRLALGHGIDTPQLGDRLCLSALPSVFLNSASAIDAYSRATENFALLIIDSMRAATPGEDENDSKISEFVDVLLKVSEVTGVTAILIHHAGKPKDSHSDTRTVGRGSSSIFASVGCELLINAGKTAADARTVKHNKTSAEAEGAPIPDFQLIVEDVAIGDDRAAGVRVLCRPVELAEASEHRQEADDRKKLLQAIQAAPGASQDVVCAKARINKKRACRELALLEHEGAIRVEVKRPGAPANAKFYWLAVSP